MNCEYITMIIDHITCWIIKIYTIYTSILYNIICKWNTIHILLLYLNVVGAWPMEVLCRMSKLIEVRDIERQIIHHTQNTHEYMCLPIDIKWRKIMEENRFVFEYFHFFARNHSLSLLSVCLFNIHFSLSIFQMIKFHLLYTN